MPLVINGTRVNKISGPVSMYLLTPRPNELFPNLPVYMLFGDQHFGTENMCKKNDTSEGVYNIYDVNFLSLFNSLSTPEQPIDFYVEGGDFHNRTFENPDPDIYPLRMVWNLYSECYGKKKLSLYPHTTDCTKIQNVRWQSGDIRYFKDEKYKKLLIKCNILNFLESMWYIDMKSLNIDVIIETLKEFKRNNGRNCIEKILKDSISFQEIYDEIERKDGLIYKQLNKNFNKNQKDQMIKYLGNYVSQVEEYNRINFETKEGMILKEIDNKLITLITRLNNSSYLDKDMESLDYLNKNFKFLEHDYRLFLFKKYSILTDMYTLSRSFKYLNSKEPIPIMNIIYFGSFHIENIANFLFNNKLYDIIFRSLPKRKQYKDNNFHDRCIEIPRIRNINIGDILTKLKLKNEAFLHPSLRKSKSLEDLFDEEFSEVEEEDN